MVDSLDRKSLNNRLFKIGRQFLIEFFSSCTLSLLHYNERSLSVVLTRFHQYSRAQLYHTCFQKILHLLAEFEKDDVVFVFLYSNAEHNYCFVGFKLSVLSTSDTSNQSRRDMFFV